MDFDVPNRFLSRCDDCYCYIWSFIDKIGRLCIYVTFASYYLHFEVWNPNKPNWILKYVYGLYVYI